MHNAEQHHASQRGILFASSDDQVFVLDIPATIAAAQSTADYEWSKQLYSRQALTAPLASLEPKSEKARSRLLARGQGIVDDSDTTRVQSISDALQIVKSSYDGPLVLPRKVACRCAAALTSPDNIDGHDAGDEAVVKDHTEAVSETLSLLVGTAHQSVISSTSTYTYSHDLTEWLPWSPCLSNPKAHSLSMHIRHASNANTTDFYLPPHSSLLLHTLPPSTPALAPTPLDGFDIILLDPPWPNKSSKRSAHYAGPRTIDDTRHLLSGLNLAAHLSDKENTVIAIWVTNSAAVLNIISGPAGWLDGLGFEVVEEWLWIKVTASGEPIYHLDGLWRKPYEVLLIAKRIPHAAQALGVKRRVLVAVPDIHSRKPSLKHLFERLLVTAPYNGLEIFARHLTASWHAWGNEVLLHNWQGHWTD